MSNYLNLITASSKKQKHDQQTSRQLLPVGETQQKLCRIVELEKSSVSILVGSHGSGKTIQMPAIVSRPRDEGPSCKSLVTQPNAINAAAVTQYMSSKDSKFGEGRLIGKVDAIRRCKGVSPPESVITYVPDEVMNTWLSTEQGLARIQEYNVIFIDDVHYKSISTELILLRIKSIMAHRDAKKAPIHFVVMSATEDISGLRLYFSISDEDVLRIAPPFEDLAKPHREKVFSEKDLHGKRLDELYLKVESIISREDNIQETGILAILPSQADVEAAAQYCSQKYTTFACKMLHQHMKRHDQIDAINCKSPKMVFATDNIILGLTVQEINVVIVTGISEIQTFDPTLAHSRPNQVRLSQAEIEQQCCRVGRQFPGKCYHQFTEAKYQSLQQYKAFRHLGRGWA